jgi:hypothetical protein
MYFGISSALWGKYCSSFKVAHSTKDGAFHFQYSIPTLEVHSGTSSVITCQKQVLHSKSRCKLRTSQQAPSNRFTIMDQHCFTQTFTAAAETLKAERRRKKESKPSVRDTYSHVQHTNIHYAINDSYNYRIYWERSFELSASFPPTLSPGLTNKIRPPIRFGLLITFLRPHSTRTILMQTLN